MTTSYHLTDEYLGKVFQADMQQQVTYYMIDQRDIHRDENSWLMLFGAFLLLSPLPFMFNAARIRANKA